MFEPTSNGTMGLTVDSPPSHYSIRNPAGNGGSARRRWSRDDGDDKNAFGKTSSNPEKGNIEAFENTYISTSTQAFSTDSAR